MSDSLADYASFKKDLELRSFAYFIDHAHPVSGLVRDRAHNLTPTPISNRRSSIAATGFGLAVLAHASTVGLISPVQAEKQIYKTLRFVQERLFHYHGWLYHFVDWETGERFYRSEVSTIDTALFLAGALYAKQIFPHSPISEIVDKLYDRIDFIDMLTDGDTAPKKLTISHGWTPEKLYIKDQWKSYSELTILVLLGLGSPNPKHALPKQAWYSWDRPKKVFPDGPPLIGYDLPLFIHQYAHLFIDFRNLHDQDYDYFKNSIIATQLDRKFAESHPQYKTYQEGFWGISASGSPEGYAAFSISNQNGTVCPGCAGASVMFEPQLLLHDLKKWSEGPYQSKIWGSYGFADSVNIDRDWFDPDALGITVGPLYLALANVDYSTSIWSVMEKAEWFLRAKKRLLDTEITVAR